MALAFVVSGLLGVLRGIIIGASFGAGEQLDAFYAAFRVPELLFNLVAGGALGSAFIPVFARYLGKEDLPGAWRLASAVMTLVTLIGGLLAILAGIFNAQITAHILIPAASPEQQALTTSLMRIMLVTVVIFSISGLVMSILNAHQRFWAPALAPSMNNVGLIIGAVLLAPRFGVYGLAAGAVIGALLHLVIQLPSLRQTKPHLRPLFDLRTSGTMEVLILMGPRILGSAVVQINFLVNTALTSGMDAGSFTALTVAFQLMFTVLGILGQSVGTAVFPSLAALGAREDYDGFRSTLAGAIRNVLFMSIPATVGMFALATPLVKTIYEHGRWTPNNTIATAWALQFFALGLVGFALQEVLARAFFALRDTITPVIVGVAGMLLNVALSLILIHVIQGRPLLFGDPANPLQSPTLWIIPAGRGPFGGLALANALATMIESAALWLLLRYRLKGIQDRQIFGSAMRGILASLAMGAVLLGITSLLRTVAAPILFFGGTILGAAVFETVALALRLPEARAVPEVFLSRFIRRRRR